MLKENLARIVVMRKYLGDGFLLLVEANMGWSAFGSPRDIVIPIADIAWMTIGAARSAADRVCYVEHRVGDQMSIVSAIWVRMARYTR